MLLYQRGFSLDQNPSDLSGKRRMREKVVEPLSVLEPQLEAERQLLKTWVCGGEDWERAQRKKERRKQKRDGVSDHKLRGFENCSKTGAIDKRQELF